MPWWLLILLAMLCSPLSARGGSMEGYSSFRSGNYPAALRQFASAPDDDPVSAFFRAQIYLTLKGEQQDQAKGMELLKVAAKGGYSPACYLLGRRLLYGEGIVANQKAAVSLLLTAAEDDYRAAVLLRLIAKKRKRPQAEQEAVIAEVKRDAAKGNHLAQFTLGFMYLIGDGVPQSSQQEAYWYRQAASRHPRAAFMLALMHYYGDGVEQSPPKAFHFMQLAAKQGDLRSAYYLGTFFYHGIGTAVDRTAAAGWLQQAAEGGDAEAQVAYALLLLAGDGVPQDKGGALEWLGKAARQENPRAKEVLRELLTYRGNPSSTSVPPLTSSPAPSQKPGDESSLKLEGKGVLLDQGVFGLKFSLPTMYDAFAPRSQQELGVRQLWERLQGGTLNIIIRPPQK